MEFNSKATPNIFLPRKALRELLKLHTCAHKFLYVCAQNSTRIEIYRDT